MIPPAPPSPSKVPIGSDSGLGFGNSCHRMTAVVGDFPALLAHEMYARLQKMSDQYKLDLSAEDVLISAYLGNNLFYRNPEPSSASTTTKTEPGTTTAITASELVGN
ncbi:uncharacterized protein LOC129757727 [Uranotaenia lowii]|uniref:uncharacterized protein LOC129757727 n=1 Tax=Uranotaenia lowii TaxID=190385 RepID=UPI00247A6DCC|nr:uncharacterized protein LOC129757727 [Uranotaenia lowii]